MKVHTEGPMPFGSPEDFIKAMTAEPIDARDIKDDDPKVKIALQFAQNQAQIFTDCVGMLMNDLNPSIPIRELMSDVWSIIGNQHVRVGMLPSNPVPELSFAAVGNPSDMRAMVLIPPNLSEMIVKNPMYIYGAVIFVGSQVRDFYNNKFMAEGDLPEVTARAKMYESEFLMAIKEHGIELNKYQNITISEYPQGIKTKPELFYNPRQTPPPRSPTTDN